MPAPDESLAARLQRNRDVDEHFSVNASAALIAKLARAVQAAHDAGAAHRALNPRAVGLRAGDAPELLDSDPSLTLPRYLAPEQARGEPPSVRGDVFSLGAILYELLGHRPPRSSESEGDVLRAAKRRPLPPLRSTSRALPKVVRHVVARATAFRAARRYASAAELADDLEACVAGSAVSARPVGLVERLDNSCLRHRRAWILLGAALLLSAGVWALSRPAL